MTNLLRIDENTINAMLADPRMLQLLPCLAQTRQRLESIQPGGANCARCQKEKKRLRAQAYGTAFDCIRRTRGETLRRLKTALNARQLRVVSHNTMGKKVEYTL